jgi:2,3-dihydroxybiphenyl 1,2-dioxygenase
MSPIAQLGYLAFEVSDLAAWERFGTNVLGLSVSDRRDDGGFALRMDSRRARIFVEPGAADDLAVVGWEARDLQAVTALLRDKGIDVTEGTPAQCAARFVEKMIRFRDPAGVPCEAFTAAVRSDEPFASSIVRSGFLAEDLGMGHLVVNSRDPEASRAFYCDLLGLKLSDRIVANIHGYQADLSFFHVEGSKSRHHSIAFGNPQRKRLHHFMIEVRSFDDVGLAFDRTLREGLKIMQTLGRHPNDRMFSFYAKTPSGFQFEYGWGGREVDDATWQPTTYDQISEWGHHPPAFVVEPPGRTPR